MITYDTIYAFENLYNAYMVARRGKRYDAEVISFEMELYANLTQLSDNLRQGMYRMSRYKLFTLHDPKERKIFAPAYHDRVVQHSLCDNVIMPVMEPRLIYDNAASRKGKGTHFALQRLNVFLRNHYRRHGVEGGSLKCDVTKYFDSIDHDIMLGILEETRQFDKRTMWLMEHIIRSYETAPGKGFPLGNQTSQWFALMYLDRMDRLVKEKLGV